MSANEKRERRSHVLMIIAGTLAVFAMLGGLSTSAEARKVPEKVKFACSSDYSRFCGKYKIGSNKARQCMRSKGRRLSDRCLRALVDTGLVSRRVLRKRRKAARRRY